MPYREQRTQNKREKEWKEEETIAAINVIW